MPEILAGRRELPRPDVFVKLLPSMQSPSRLTQQNGITSEPITLQPGTSPVPEPGTFALLGTGILAAAFTTKKLSS